MKGFNRKTTAMLIVLLVALAALSCGSLTRSPTPAPTPTPTEVPTGRTSIQALSEYSKPKDAGQPADILELQQLEAAAPENDAAADCADLEFDRSTWGDYPQGSALGTELTWAKPADDLNSMAVTVDHHVALHDAHVSGGCEWEAELKQQFSRDRDNLNPTARSFNSSKGSRTPDRLVGIASRVIDTPEERCEYALQHQEIKRKYRLTMTEPETETVARWIAACPGQ